MSSTIHQIGRYRVTRVLGEGGMGVVYAAHDDRLDRPVAIKVVRPEALSDTTARERFKREARAAAKVSHPNICPLYEFDEVDGQQFLVMELLSGETLAARLERGPIPVEEAMPMAATMLDALAALHRCGIIHRDLKPANVFLTPHGPRLLDFGLAQPAAGGDHTQEARLTGRGVLVGTPQFMAPEQLHGQDADERADVFAAAAVIYQMLAGCPAFGGKTLPEIIHAVGYLEPAPLPAFAGAAAIDRVLRRALAKDPAQRTDRVETLASQLREAARTTDTQASIAPDHQTRFVALPLRVLRPDPETDFLAFSVPDAVSSALANIESVIVRVPRAVAADADVRAIGRDFAVDVVLTGTILRAGAHVRVTAQLSDSAGTLIWSDTAQAPIADLFQLQDAITARIVSSLSLPLSARDRRALDKQAPANAEAYALFMRANQMMTDNSQWEAARLLYERAVQLDPNYAPAWAGLGRARRLIAKWGGPSGKGLLPQAEAAFQRALELDPDLSSAHDLSAYVESELGRAPEAVARLIRRAANHRADPGLYAGLVTTCRYAGLLEASVAAQARAVAIDPAVVTSVAWTHFMLGDYDSTIATQRDTVPFPAVLAQVARGNLEPGSLSRLETHAGSPGMRLALRGYRHALDGRIDAALATMEELRASGFADPEGWYLNAFILARAGGPEHSLDLLTRSIDGGYACHAPLSREAVWDPLRGDPRFDALVQRAAALVARAQALYDEAGGKSVLG
ncbi:MAG TPA: protein kinase [Vicinamibacterales bacterium]|nr:protein kinase [Vicinamibacterales bacterium]